MMTDAVHTLELASERANIVHVEPFLQRIGIADLVDTTRYYNLVVAATEAVNNAIIHGNTECSDKMVTLVVSVSWLRICISIRDMGSGFDASQVPDPRLPENLEKEGGRGVFLMHQLADAVEVHRHDDGTEIVLIYER